VCVREEKRKLRFRGVGVTTVWWGYSRGQSSQQTGDGLFRRIYAKDITRMYGRRDDIIKHYMKRDMKRRSTADLWGKAKMAAVINGGLFRVRRRKKKSKGPAPPLSRCNPKPARGKSSALDCTRGDFLSTVGKHWWFHMYTCQNFCLDVHIPPILHATTCRPNVEYVRRPKCRYPLLAPHFNLSILSDMRCSLDAARQANARGRRLFNLTKELRKVACRLGGWFTN
jgi:hypothetical protein